MATGARNEPGDEGVEFIHEDDGSITARDIETGVASFGETKSEALRMLAAALALHEGEEEEEEPITDEHLAELGIDPDDAGNEELPGFMR